MTLIKTEDIVPCSEAVNTICADGSCGKIHCDKCKRHLCPVCKKHYRVAIFAGDPEGCSGDCIKITRGDTEPYIPEHVKHERLLDQQTPGWRAHPSTIPPMTVIDGITIWDSSKGGKQVFVDLTAPLTGDMVTDEAIIAKQLTDREKPGYMTKTQYEGDEPDGTEEPGGRDTGRGH